MVGGGAQATSCGCSGTMACAGDADDAYDTLPLAPSSLKMIGKYRLRTTLQQNGEDVGGSGGIVRRGYELSGGSTGVRRVAVKEMSVKTDEALLQARTEAVILAKMDHPHIIPLLDVHEADGRLFMVMPLMRRGDIFSFVHEHEQLGTELYHSNVRVWFVQLLQAVEYMHEQGFLHLDLKPENVLIDADLNVVLCDFGHACPFDATVRDCPAHYATAAYGAPEAQYVRANGEAKSFFDALGIRKEEGQEAPLVFGPELDVWALGATLYFMLTDHFAFSDEDEDGYVLEFVLDVLIDEPCYDFPIPDLCRELLQGMFAKHPDDRLTLEDVKRCEWLVDEMDDGKTEGGREPYSSSGEESDKDSPRPRFRPGVESDLNLMSRSVSPDWPEPIV